MPIASRACASLSMGLDDESSRRLSTRVTVGFNRHDAVFDEQESHDTQPKPRAYAPECQGSPVRWEEGGGSLVFLSVSSACQSRLAPQLLCSTHSPPRLLGRWLKAQGMPGQRRPVLRPCSSSCRVRPCSYSCAQAANSCKSACIGSVWMDWK